MYYRVYVEHTGEVTSLSLAEYELTCSFNMSEFPSDLNTCTMSLLVEDHINLNASIVAESEYFQQNSEFEVEAETSAKVSKHD